MNKTVEKILSILPDKAYICLKYWYHFRRLPNLKAPKTFNEKLQWLKLYNHRPEYMMMVDKYLVRDYICEKLGEEYIIPLLGVWDSPDEIDFEALPEKFVLKCNHNSGLGMYICTDKSRMDVEKVKNDLSRGLAQDYYLTGREWPYKNVPRKIIAEQYMQDDETNDLRDYKFYCFDGVPKAVLIICGRSTGEATGDIFDMESNFLDFTWGYPHATEKPPMPKNFDKMKEFASILSAGIPHVRVDFYEVEGQIYFGELTFFDDSGFGAIKPKAWDETLGSWLKLPTEKVRSGGSR